MSEQEQGAMDDAPEQPPVQGDPMPTSTDPAQPAGPGQDGVDAVPVDPLGATPVPLRSEEPTSADSGLADDDRAAFDAPQPAPDVDEGYVVAAPVPRRVDAPAPQGDPDPEGLHAGEPQREPSSDALAMTAAITALGESLAAQAAATQEALAAQARAAAEQLDAHTQATQRQLTALADGVAEANRLRSRDQAHVEQLHTDNTALRRGELTSAMAPLLSGLVRLSDQMASMAAGDKHSIAGMLRVQLLQTMDVAAGVTEFAPADGEPFDTKRMTGADREDTADPDQDGTVCRTVRSGFARGDGSIVRVAEVVVRRLAPTTRPAGAGSEQ